jgi:hypothetical protein
VSIAPSRLTHENRPECYNFSTCRPRRWRRSRTLNRDAITRSRFDAPSSLRSVRRRVCLELKALKYYLIDFRNKGIFYEAVTNQILDDLVAACSPRRMTVVGDFSVRGGISTTVTAAYEKGKSRKLKVKS